jgi:hypothetical protein
MIGLGGSHFGSLLAVVVADMVLEADTASIGATNHHVEEVERKEPR